MTARSIWNGSLEVGDHSLPIKMYAAVQDVKVRFNLLHDSDLTRLKQRWVAADGAETEDDPVGDAATASRLLKGYPLPDGRFVVLHDAELEQLVPKPSRSIELGAFVPLEAIDPVWYVRPYFLGPSSLSEDYYALAHVLGERRLAGIARWVMRKHAYHGALVAADGHLMLHTLRERQEVLVAPSVKPAARAFDARELKMADQLIDALVGDFEPSAFEDVHRQRVLELIEKKATGLPAATHSKPATKSEHAEGLADALERSLEALGKPKPITKSSKAREERKSA